MKKQIELNALNPIEKTRTYNFAHGEHIVLENVTHLAVSKSGVHRLKTKDGKLHIVPPGWLHIELDTKTFTF